MMLDGGRSCRSRNIRRRTALCEDFLQSLYIISTLIGCRCRDTIFCGANANRGHVFTLSQKIMVVE